MASHEGLGSTVDLPLVFYWRLPGREVLPLDIVSALTLMISFGMLVAFIVSNHSQKK
ncbi:putative holin-like toxin [Bacillaceae bacterium YX66]